MIDIETAVPQHRVEIGAHLPRRDVLPVELVRLDIPAHADVERQLLVRTPVILCVKAGLRVVGRNIRIPGAVLRLTRESKIFCRVESIDRRPYKRLARDVLQSIDVASDFYYVVATNSQPRVRVVMPERNTVLHPTLPAVAATQSSNALIVQANKRSVLWCRVPVPAREIEQRFMQLRSVGPGAFRHHTVHFISHILSGLNARTTTEAAYIRFKTASVTEFIARILARREIQFRQKQIRAKWRLI